MSEEKDLGPYWETIKADKRKMTFRENVDKDIKDSYEKTHSCSYWDIFISNFEKLIDEKIKDVKSDNLQDVKVSLLLELKEELKRK